MVLLISGAKVNFPAFPQPEKPELKLSALVPLNKKRTHIMKINRTIQFALLIIIGLAGFACEGPAGSQGPQGEVGAPGPQGESGTANVIYSPWIDSDWTEEDQQYWGMVIEDSNISVEFSNTGGTVLVYRRNGSSDDAWVYQLPSGNAYRVNYAIDPVNTSLLIAVESTCCDIPSWFHDVQLRYVLIPGGMLTNGLQAKLDVTDYEAVAAYYGLQDEGAGIVRN